jgi:tetratricopeptide (TPR) repeat protein
MRYVLARVAFVGLALVAVGCATTGRPPELTLREAESPVWSINPTNDELIVAVSPAGKTLRIAGSAGLVIGTSVDAVVNARYRNQIEELLGEDDTFEMLLEGLEERLDEAAGSKLTQVAPLSTTAGYDNRRDALAARYEGLARQDHDMLLQLRTTQGVFGHEGTLAIKLDGRQVALPSGSTLWSEDIVVTLEPALAFDRLGDPTDRMSPQIRGARLTVERGALDKWRQGERSLREDFQAAVDAAAAALVVSLGLAEDPVGEYHLGLLALNRKDFEEALERLSKATQLKPDFVDARNAFTVALAHNGAVDRAIESAKTLTEEHPDYGPAFLNLAWWYVIEKDDPVAAKPFYQRALELGMEPVGKIEDELS